MFKIVGFEESSCPSRDTSTVDLEKGKKDFLLEDIEDYLKPSARTYHANRGIPVRTPKALIHPI